MPSYDNSTKVSLRGLLIVATHLFVVFWEFSIFDSRKFQHVTVVASTLCLLILDKEQTNILVQKFHIPSSKHGFYDAAC